jgi:UDP-N-acetylglucosamine diphosphorylase/glucosamine-1-phosphate N-acetyltransferase
VSFDPPTAGEAVVSPAGDLLALELDRASAEAFLTGGMRMPAGLRRREVAATGLLTRPWELISIAREHLPGDLEAADLPRWTAGLPGVTIRGDHAVKVAPDATLKPPIALDASGGPIVIESGAVVEPMTTLEGPCCVGAGSTVVRHGDVRRNTIVGPGCKVGGEVSGSILQGHANKSHFGFLGDSYLGEWVNLGAGTTTSNLKNTYGTVSMRDSAALEPEATGMQFLGSIIGDHVKTAIGTRLATGTCVGTAAMLALSRFPPRYVDRFTFLTDAGAERYDLTRFLEVAQRVMQRRGRAVSAALATRLRALHGQSD